MTLYEFNRLPDDQQLEMGWDQATVLVRRKIGQSHRMLYSLCSFYVEIPYNPDQNEPTACRSFGSLIPLEPYPQAVQLTELRSV